MVYAPRYFVKYKNKKAMDTLGVISMAMGGVEFVQLFTSIFLFHDIVTCFPGFSLTYIPIQLSIVVIL